MKPTMLTQLNDFDKIKAHKYNICMKYDKGAMVYKFHVPNS